MTEKIFRIIVADDHSVVTEGIRVILKSDIRFKVCGIFANADSVLKFLEREEIDIIVLDIDMPGANKFSLLKAIKENYPQVKVVIFTMHEGMNYFLKQEKMEQIRMHSNQNP
jgi:DNA-binding NarL/FixJ family response regulator